MKASLVILTVLVPIMSCTYNPYVQGARLYEIHCSNCHMSDGVGLGSLYPPLNGPSYREDFANDFACIVRHGLSDTIIIGMQIYDTPMEGLPDLSSAEIANIYNFIAHSWHPSLEKLSQEIVEQNLERCLGRK
ncbi:MAG: cytochrome c [Saprospiraceae bacterium]|nr:cytochrome c [Saprospiraceae bacterium]